MNSECTGGGVDSARTQETNPGNLTADIDLRYRRQLDETVVASVENGMSRFEPGRCDRGAT